MHASTSYGRFYTDAGLWGIEAQQPSVTANTAEPPWQVSTESPWQGWTELRDTGGTESIVSKIESLFEQLERLGVVLVQADEVYGFLLRYPDLIEIVGKVASLAGFRLPHAELRLQVYRDPESDDEYLLLCARFREYDEKTMERIRNVRREYRPLLANKPAWLLLTTDFRPPEEEGRELQLGRIFVSGV